MLPARAAPRHKAFIGSDRRACFENLAQQIVNAATIGGMYTLVAIGFTLFSESSASSTSPMEKSSCWALLRLY